MKSLNNNKGLTLVEVIVGSVLLVIATTMLLRGFITTANILNRATLFKNASITSSSSIELQEVQESKLEEVDVELTKESNTFTVNLQSGSGSVNFNVRGEIIVGTDNGTGGSGLVYREFLPGTYDFDVPAVEID